MPFPCVLFSVAVLEVFPTLSREKGRHSERTVVTYITLGIDLDIKPVAAHTGETRPLAHPGHSPALQEHFAR